MIAKSDRIKLRYAKPSDAEPLFSYTGDLASSKYLARNPHSHHEQTLSMLKQLSTKESIARHGKCVWVISLCEIDAPIGIITLIDIGSKVEIHFGLIPKFTGQGFESEALSLAASHCSRVNNKNVISFTDLENISAQKSLIRSGFKCTEEKRHFYVAPQLSNCKRSVFCYVYSV